MIVGLDEAQLVLRQMERWQPKTSPFWQLASAKRDGSIAVGVEETNVIEMLEEVYLRRR
jgi:hypothetical protein